VARSLAASGDTERADQLKALAGALEELREREVRDLAHALFPAGIELGAIRAIQALINRLPPQIEVGLHLGAALKSRVDEGGPLMPLAERLIVVSAVEEAITNALKHGGATRLTLELELDPTADGTGQILRGAVVDNGRGIGGSSRPVGAGGKGGDGGRGLSADAVGAGETGAAVSAEADGAADAATGRQAALGADWVVSGKPGTTGLRRTAERFRKRGGYLRLEQADAGGARLEFSLPLPREWDA
jgi:signal transduction histidine kinase